MNVPERPEGLSQLSISPWPGLPMATPAKQVCPVCSGKTVVRYDFYPDRVPYVGEWTKCRSCHGRGVV